MTDELNTERIAQLRGRVNLTEVVRSCVSLAPKGRVMVGACPFCGLACFNVNEERGFYHCFGCSASGDVFSFLRRVRGLSFQDAAWHLHLTELWRKASRETRKAAL